MPLLCSQFDSITRARGQSCLQKVLNLNLETCRGWWLSRHPGSRELEREPCRSRGKVGVPRSLSQPC